MSILDSKGIKKDDVDDAHWMVPQPPSVRFEWKWLIEIFICETHVTPAAQHGMISSANCPPYEGENIFQGFGRTFLCQLPTFGQLGLGWFDASVLCQMKSFLTTDQF